jgi:hypothetical protein
MMYVEGPLLPVSEPAVWIHCFFLCLKRAPVKVSEEGQLRNLNSHFLMTYHHLHFLIVL